MEEKELRKIISTNIRMQRAKKDITQEHLADLINLSATQLGALERGVSMPKIITLIKLAEIFELKVDDLLH